MVQKLSAIKLGKISEEPAIYFLERINKHPTKNVCDTRTNIFIVRRKKQHVYFCTFSNWFPSGTIGETLVTVHGAPKMGVLTFWLWYRILQTTTSSLVYAVTRDWTVIDTFTRNQFALPLRVTLSAKEIFLCMFLIRR